MNPEIEPLLEEKLASLAPTSNLVGRVSVEPDYESGLTATDIQQLRTELEEVLSTVPVSADAINGHDGQTVDFKAFPTLTRFIRKISLHGGDAVEPWVDVVPPGNWI